MILTLRNIGLIHELDLDLSKPLLVFSGPNNTGKTYASYTLYGLHKLSLRPEILSMVLDFGHEVSTLCSTGVLSFDFSGYVLEHKGQIIETITRNLKAYLPDVFASTPSHFADAEIGLQIDDRSWTDSFVQSAYNIILPTGADFQLEVQKSEGSSTVEILLTQKIGVESNQMPASGLVGRVMANWVGHQIMHHLLAKPFIIPAERIAIQLFAREMALARSRSIDQFYASPAKDAAVNVLNLANRANLYPLPIRDALLLNEDFSVLRRSKSSLSPLAAWLEKSVLGGKIGIGKEGEVGYQPSDTKKTMPLHTAASMVKSLAVLVLYLRHVAQPGDLLILDEPELNLHPDNQVQLARLIARCINSGIKVLMTTHSDYLVRELNNLVMLGSIQGSKKDLMNRYGYAQADLIDYRKIGAYGFGPGSGAYPQKLDIRPDGFSVPTMDAVTGSQNLAADEISYYLAQEMLEHQH